jgi:hypothetical protein
MDAPRLYGRPFYGRYLDVLRATPGRQQVLGNARINTVPVERSRPLAAALAADLNWRELPAGRGAALFVPARGNALSVPSGR